MICVVFFLNDTATTEIYTLSLHDALPICRRRSRRPNERARNAGPCQDQGTHGRKRAHGAIRVLGTQPSHEGTTIDRKSTRLNSSHANISYAVFCLKKKKTSYAPSLLFLFV